MIEDNNFYGSKGLLKKVRKQCKKSNSEKDVVLHVATEMRKKGVIKKLFSGTNLELFSADILINDKILTISTEQKSH